jgi:hypothetical protein
MIVHEKSIKQKILDNHSARIEFITENFRDRHALVVELCDKYENHIYTNSYENISGDSLTRMVSERLNNIIKGN